MKITYQALLDPQPDGGFTVTFPDLPDAITEGESEAEALFNAAEVLTLTLEGRMDEGEAIPKPGKHRGICVSPSPACQAALLVRRTRAERPLSDLARALETSWAAAQRLEDPHHATTVRQLDRVAAAYGKRLVLSFAPATDSAGRGAETLARAPGSRAHSNAARSDVRTARTASRSMAGRPGRKPPSGSRS